VASLYAFPALAEKSCGQGEGGAAARINGLLVQVKPLADGSGCRAIVRGRDGRISFARKGQAIRLLGVSGSDLNGDGQPDAVFENFDGGAHCCWTYWIVSLGDHPGLIREIYNYRGVGFIKSKRDGKIVIETMDGLFDYFDGISHAVAPFPSVYLVLEGQNLRRVNEEFWPRYASEIRQEESALKNDSVIVFRRGDNSQTDFEATKSSILTIILAYLYGGKPEEAWRALHKYWPPKDEKRMRRLIEKTANRGFLGDTSRPRYGIIE
jgi:hypothetical protein